MVLTAALTAPLVCGAGTAYADSGTEDGADVEDYEIPDDIGSAPWW
jgi:hypothetical protein